MRFLIDRCAGRRLAEWLRQQGHDVVESRERGPDPGDVVVLEWAFREGRILVTMDKDFGDIVYVRGHSHRGLVRLPDVPVERRIALMRMVLDGYTPDLEAGCVITVRGGRVRISRAPA